MNRTLRSLIAPASALLALVLSSPAYALTCDEIMNMVNVKVPTNIVVQTMKDSGETFSAADVKCLVESGAPSDVVTQAKAMTAQEAPAAPPPAATTTTPTKKASSLDTDTDTIGSHTTTSTKPKTKPKDLTDKGEDTSAALPDEIQQAVNLIDAKKPLTASLELFEDLDGNKYPDNELQLHYYLAQSLSDLELYSAAQYHFTWVVKSLIASNNLNSEFFTNSLAKLVAIARLSGDNSELIRLLPKLTPDQYPRGAQNTLYYLVGLRMFEEDQLADARKYFAQVNPKSDLYLKSEYLQGVIENKQGKLKSAVKAFREVYRAPIDNTTDPDELKRTQDLKDLALIDIARIYYGIERYDQAAKYFDLVNRDSRYWGESIFEDAWARFMQNDLNVTLGKLLTVKSPFFARDEFMPEATVLRALTFFNLCQYPEVQKTLLDFEDKYKPMQAEMRDFVKSYSTDEGKQLADQAWDAYFGSGSKKDTKLPKSLFNKILLNQDLSAIVTRLDMMDKEEGIIDQQKSRWKDSLGANLKDLMEKDRQRLKRRAGLLFLSEMARQANYLNDLLTQSEIIRFEVVDAQRVDYQYKMQNPEALKTYQSTQVDFATSTDIIYWPFNGEFWKDELGYYIYTEKATCK